MDLSRAVEEYLTYLAVDRARSPRTLRAYATDLRAPLAFWAGLSRPLCSTADLTRDAVRAWQRQLGQRGLRLSSRARQLQALRGFLRHARREGWVATDLFAHLDLPRAPRPLPRPLPTDQVRALVAWRFDPGEAGQRDSALVHFLLSTGCRISEALAVDRHQLRGDGGLVVRGKGGRDRTVKISHEAARRLQKRCWRAMLARAEAPGTAARLRALQRRAPALRAPGRRGADPGASVPSPGSANRTTG